SRGAARHRGARGAPARRKGAGADRAERPRPRQGARPVRRPVATRRDRPRAAAPAAHPAPRRADRRTRHQIARRHARPCPQARRRGARLRAVGAPPHRGGRRPRRRDRAASGPHPGAWAGRASAFRHRGPRHPDGVHDSGRNARGRAERGRMTAEAVSRAEGFSLAHYAICLKGIVWREALRFLHQRERFIAALVRPLVWLFIFAAGFRQVLGVSIIPPYDTYVLYEVYITPGLIAMIQMFNGMLSSLSMVYDREMGNMRTLLVSPLPRWYLLSSK